MTIHELMQAALECENIFLATLLYWALQNDKLTLDQSADQLELLHLSDIEKKQVRYMVKTDILGIRRIKLFAFHIAETNYALYFATSVQSAAQAYEHMYKKMPTKAYDVYDRLKYREFYFDSLHAQLSIEQLKKQVATFPYFVGVLEGKSK